MKRKLSFLSPESYSSAVLFQILIFQPTNKQSCTLKENMEKQ